MRDIARKLARYDASAKIDSPERHSAKGWLVIGGIVFCFTLLGALIGIPMIIIGLKMKSYETGAWVGECPCCSKVLYWHSTADNQINSNTAQGRFSCPGCHALVNFHAGEFLHEAPV